MVDIYPNYTYFFMFFPFLKKFIVQIYLDSIPKKKKPKGNTKCSIFGPFSLSPQEDSK